MLDENPSIGLATEDRVLHELGQTLIRIEVPGS